jgi:Fe-S oxidoreductase
VGNRFFLAIFVCYGKTSFGGLMIDSKHYRRILDKSIERDLLRCIGCHECLNVCPVSDSGLTIAQLNDAALCLDEFSQSVHTFARNCFSCGLCDHVCPAGCKKSDLLLVIKSLIEKSDLYSKFDQSRGPSPNFGTKWAREWDNRTSKNKAQRRRAKLDGQKFEPANTVFYFGCHALFKEDIVDKTLDLAQRALPHFEVISGKDHCCGRREYLAGDFSRAAELISGLARTFEKMRPDVIVTGCSECFGAIHSLRYSETGQQVPYRVLSIGQWILENEEAFFPASENEDSEKPFVRESQVALMPSCQSRKSGLAVAAENLLGHFYETVHRVEGENGPLCCGANYFEPPPSPAVAPLVLATKELAEKEHSLMVVDCANCKQALMQTADLPQTLVIKHIVELVHQKLNEQEAQWPST